MYSPVIYFASEHFLFPEFWPHPFVCLIHEFPEKRPKQCEHAIDLYKSKSSVHYSEACMGHLNKWNKCANWTCASAFDKPTSWSGLIIIIINYSHIALY